MNVGDIVVLKSSGPEMTVLSVYTGSGISEPAVPMAKCCWFPGYTNYATGCFPVASLELKHQDEQ